MNSQQPTGTSLEVLAPYLPYGIAVRDIAADGPFVGDTHILRGIDTQADFPVLVGGGESSDIAYAFHGVLPVLRPFSALCDPLPDGTVPAEVIGEMMHPGYDGIFAKLDSSILGLTPVIELRGDCNLTSISVLTPSDIEQNDLPTRAANYLRSLHFAVGLEPHQYIVKEVANV